MTTLPSLSIPSPEVAYESVISAIDPFTIVQHLSICLDLVPDEQFLSSLLQHLVKRSIRITQLSLLRSSPFTPLLQLHSLPDPFITLLSTANVQILSVNGLLIHQNPNPNPNPNPNLTLNTLSLTGVCPTFLPSICYNCNLASLSLIGCSLNYSDLDLLINVVNLFNLKYLNLYNNPDFGSFVHLLLQNVSLSKLIQLKYLNLGRTELSAEACETLVSKFESVSSHHDFWSNISNIELEELNLNLNYFTDVMCLNISKLIVMISSLSTLKISGCHLTFAHLMLISKAINRSLLKTIDLSHNDVTAESILSMFDQNGADDTCHLQTLDLSYTKISDSCFTDFALKTSFFYLKSINLSGCTFYSNSTDALLLLLGHVENLVLDKCLLGTEILHQIFKSGVSDRLVSLSMCHLSPKLKYSVEEFVSLLQSFLFNCPKIQCFSLIGSFSSMEMLFKLSATSLFWETLHEFGDFLEYLGFIEGFNYLNLGDVPGSKSQGQKEQLDEQIVEENREMDQLDEQLDEQINEQIVEENREMDQLDEQLDEQINEQIVEENREMDQLDEQLDEQINEQIVEENREMDQLDEQINEQIVEENREMDQLDEQLDEQINEQIVEENREMDQLDEQLDEQIVEENREMDQLDEQLDEQINEQIVEENREMDQLDEQLDEQINEQIVEENREMDQLDEQIDEQIVEEKS
ncbi:hypothetical protein P9112_000403 [Eukaryota sp. TZLM1-RC]